MKNKLELLETICSKAASLLGIGIFGAFSFWAAKYKHEYSHDLSSERIVGYLDNRAMNIIILLLFFSFVSVVGFIFLRGESARVHRRIHIFAILAAIMTGVTLSIWVSICKITPIWDQLQVFYGALDFHQGNFSLMESYYDTYPHQYGLTFIYELFIGIFPYYRFFQYMNVVFVMLIIYFVYLLTDELFHSEKANLYAIIATLLFSPLYLYVNFVYGELWNMAFGVISIWATVKWLHNPKWRFALTAITSITIAYIARESILVWAIAITIILFVKAIRELNLHLFLFGTLIILVPIIALQAVHISYEVRSGKQIGEGTPHLAYLAMGLHDNWEGPGYYDAYNDLVYISQANRDASLAKELALADIKTHLAEFKANPLYARDFYQRKTWNQWNEGTFNSLIMTCHFETPPNNFVTRVYYGDMAETIYKWGNYYLFILYFFVFAYALFSFVQNRKIENILLLVVLIGGFLLSILWEAKARYTFPYTVLLFPMVAKGLSLISDFIYHFIKIVCSRFHTKKDKG